ncbi:InlB B-repeat-containing protein [Usitatibacter palustris]|uniref:Uncharacterized protein n=1 Tax=Usitatibacter palustris TaxID=2732487 RepID=A0A6M4H3U8_9PROT|nr:hypothetical protein [Usitatibacter palustris]QJR13383.1 hypothetical protein DSM104440_00166 [Usitatibacter palustris]
MNVGTLRRICGGLLLSAAQLVHAIPGYLDTSFGAFGFAQVLAGPSYDEIHAVRIQPDGKIVVAGQSAQGRGRASFALARYNVDGSLDATFGTNGVVAASVSGADSRAYAMVLQADGKIVVAGAANNSSPQWLVTRFNANGSPDTGFGNGGKTLVATVAGAGSVQGLALQSDGRIVMTGTTNSEFAVARLTTSGLLDATFGSGGVTVTALPGDNWAYALAVQADDRIVVAGTVGLSGNFDFLLMRYTASGVLDASFGGTGYVVTSLQASWDWARALLIQPDGKIVAGGYSSSGSDEDFGLVRYQADGTLDATFGNAGRVTSGFTAGHHDRILGLALAGDGKIVATGFTRNGSAATADFATARYNIDGSLDTSFGTGGKVVTPFAGGCNIANALAIQSNGAIVVTGTAPMVDGNSAFALVRYSQTGTLDASFGSGGIVLTPDVMHAVPKLSGVAALPDGRIVVAGSAGASGSDVVLIGLTASGAMDSTFGQAGRVVTGGVGNQVANAMTVRPDGRIVVVGGAAGSSNFLVGQFNPGGSPDGSFGTGGLVTHATGNASNLRAVALQPDGKIVGGGSVEYLGRQAFALVRYLASGPLDVSFGNGGLAIVPFGSLDEGIYAIAIQPDGKIVAGGAEHGASNEFALARYNTNGSPDASFGAGGKVAGIMNGVIRSIVVQPDGKIVVAGDSKQPLGARRDFGIARFNSNGTLDASFGSSGRVWTEFGADAQPVSVLINDGKLIVGGYNATATNYSLARYLANGTLDVAFGISGKISHFVGTVPDFAAAMTLQDDGHILLVGNSPSAGVVARFLNPDSIPSPFAFAPLAGQARSTLVQSAAITLRGFNEWTPISIVGGEYSIGCTGTFTASTATISYGQTVCVRHTSSASYATVTTTTLTIGGVSAVFTSTTAATPHLLTVAKAGSGGGIVTGDLGGGPTIINCGSDCTESVLTGSIVTLTATPASGSSVAGWSHCSGTAPVCEVPVSAATTVTVTFASNLPRLANISTRGQVLTGNDVMIAGFIIGGPEAKTVVVTVAGPSLVAAGIPNALANPTLTLVRSSDGVVVATNDNWLAQPNHADVAAIQNAGFAPANALEPAIIATLAPGAYTAIVQGSGGTGVGLVGVFEVDHAEAPLINISTRGQVLTGNDVMIAGFIIQGSGTKSVVVTVAGPSLTAAGVPGALQNPTLTIVRASDGAVIASNDDWQAQTNPAHVAAIQNAGFAPAHVNEPAVFLTLPPGAYTAIVQGAGGRTGVGLVAVYAVP